MYTSIYDKENNSMIKRNKLGVLNNSYQGNHRKVLTVCSAGCLRSPTAAHILSSDPWNFNTRAAGLNDEYAIVPVTFELVYWADSIIVMEEWMVNEINEFQSAMEDKFHGFDQYVWKNVINLDIEDNYGYRDQRLVQIMSSKFKELWPA